MWKLYHDCKTLYILKDNYLAVSVLECKRYFSPFLLIACWVCSEFTWHLSIVYLYSASQRDVSDFKSFCLVSISVLQNVKHVMPSHNVCCMLCLVFAQVIFYFSQFHDTCGVLSVWFYGRIWKRAQSFL